MNLVLFESGEIGVPLERGDRRVRHVLEVLKRKEGEAFDAGVVNGARGKGVITMLNETQATIAFTPGEPAVPAPPITVIVGLPRPQTARDVLRDVTTLGAAALHFVRTEKAERSYVQSTLWSSGEWRRHVLAGAEQAFDTRLPQVEHGRTLAETLDALMADSTGALLTRVALDNYEAKAALSETPIRREAHVVLAIGGERGWSAKERDSLRAHGFALVHLGTRVLRTETAAVAALAIVRSKLGLM